MRAIRLLALIALTLLLVPQFANAQSPGFTSSFAGSYYSGSNFTTLMGSQNDANPLNISWTATQSPFAGIPGGTPFSVRWTNTFHAPYTGQYTFTTTSDDGVRVSVGGTQVINDWSTQSATTTIGTPITLTGGQSYPVTVEYFENGQGGGSISLTYTTPPAPPAAPTNLTAAAGNASVVLQWNSSGGGASYDMYRKTNPTDPYVKIGSAPAAFTTGLYQDNAVVNGTTYTYEVVALNNGLTSGASNPATATPLAPNYQGHLDAANDNGISGWAEDSTQPGTAISVYITGYGYATAGNYRQDVGSHGFSVAMPASLQDGQAHVIHAYYPNNVELPGSPITYTYVPVDNATFVSQTPPPTIRAGQTYQVAVTMYNSGNTTWTVGTYQLLSQNPNNNNWWQVQTVNLPASVPPKTPVTFSFPVVAPSVTNPGSYHFQWQMIHQGVGTFGTPTTDQVCSNPADDAAFVSQSGMPTTVRTGQNYQVSITMRNIGTNAWPVGSYQLLSQNPTSNTWWHVALVDIPAPVPSGGQVTFSFAVTTPVSPGVHDYQWQMIHQGVGAFGDLTADIPVNVIQAPPSLQAASTNQALSASPPYFSGTNCYTVASAAPLGGYITHAQMLINGILVGEYDDTGTTPYSTDPMLVHTYGTQQTGTNMSIHFDSTHFADNTQLPITLKVWDSSGQNGAVTVTAPIYNQAYVLGNQAPNGSLNYGSTSEQHINGLASSMNLLPFGSTSDTKQTILSSLPIYTVFYIDSHGNTGVFGDCYAQGASPPGQPPLPRSGANYILYANPTYYPDPTGSLTIMEAVNQKTIHEPPYSFVDADACLTAGTSTTSLDTNLADAFGVRNPGTDQAFLGWVTETDDSPTNTSWVNQVWQKLHDGWTLIDAVGNANSLFSPQNTQNGQVTLAVSHVFGDNNMTLHSVYGGGRGQWYH